MLHPFNVHIPNRESFTGVNFCDFRGFLEKRKSVSYIYKSSTLNIVYKCPGLVLQKFNRKNPHTVDTVKV